MLFGTDGIRGPASLFFDGRLAYNVGRAVASRFDAPKKIVIARDTRLSGFDVEQEVIAGLLECRAEIYRLEIMPTPAVAEILKAVGADYGIMISASHNPPEYNGIKIFDRTGQKLTADEEVEIEKKFFEAQNGSSIPKNGDIGNTSRGGEAADSAKNADNARGLSPKGRAFCRGGGKIVNLANAPEMYAASLFDRCRPSLKGLKIKLDCCFGACARLAPDIFARVGASVSAFADEYDGSMINVSTGSTNIGFLTANMSAENDFLGFAFDGDGDRVTAVTPNGFVADGDYILYILTLYFKKHGLLRHDTVVGTLMTNTGLERALNDIGVALIRTDVGDKYVIESINGGGYSLGGETSGHIIINENGGGATGDGILSALMLCRALDDLGVSPDAIGRLYAPYPLKTAGIAVPENAKRTLMQNPRLNALKELCEDELRGEGRILVRGSGTEPKIRITVEAKSPELVDDVMRLLESAYRSEAESLL
ncbi:MAG: phosphoglucosamine mutase [Clostridiales bacterium]|jgi:phosphoglucosamine mutase|nr:phosphoglucosamine mutase [Clostridiales bacterium]